MKPLLPAALALAAALSVSAVAQPPPGGPPPATGRACFWTRSITNFATDNDRVLYLRVSLRDVWELKLFSPCLDIEWAHHVAILSRPGGLTSTNVCEGSNPPLDVVVRQIGLGRQRCPVTYARKLTPEEVAALPKLARP